MTETSGRAVRLGATRPAAAHAEPHPGLSTLRTPNGAAGPGGALA